MKFRFWENRKTLIQNYDVVPDIVVGNGWRNACVASTEMVYC
jgi:hypothetical protein